MFEIEIPFKIKGVPFRPEQTGIVKVVEVLIQTISTLAGWDGEARRLLTCALNGSLHVASSQVEAIINRVSTAPNQHITFTDTPTTEIMILADRTNLGDVWIQVGKVAAVDDGWYLDAGDYVQLSVNNLSVLDILLTANADMITIIQSV